MGLNVIGEAFDHRSNTRVIYAQADVRTYLNIIGENFDEFDIQRRRVKHKAYGRMRKDIISGTLLPPITLALKEQFIDKIKNIYSNNELSSFLSTPNMVNILDGLQRTHILKEIIDENIKLHNNQKIFLEIWLEKDINNLIYRIIVLNAGQKPMSMRHQIELLFSSIKNKLESNISGLEIFLERDNARRTKAKKYSFYILSLSFYAYITKSPEIDKDNIIAQQLQEDEILSEGEEKFKNNFDRFEYLLSRYTIIDELLSKSSDNMNWIGSQNVMVSFFSAAGCYDSRDNGSQRVDKAIEHLINNLKNTSNVDEIIAINDYKKIIKGFNPRKINIGVAIRRLLFASFKEYFRSEGEILFKDLWIQEAN